MPAKPLASSGVSNPPLPKLPGAGTGTPSAPAASLPKQPVVGSQSPTPPATPQMGDEGLTGMLTSFEGPTPPAPPLPSSPSAEEAAEPLLDTNLPVKDETPPPIPKQPQSDIPTPWRKTVSGYRSVPGIATPYAGFSDQDRQVFDQALSEYQQAVSDPSKMSQWQKAWAPKIQGKVENMAQDWANRMAEQYGLGDADRGKLMSLVLKKVSEDGWDLNDIDAAARGFAEVIAGDPETYATLLGDPNLAPIFAQAKAENQDLYDLTKGPPDKLIKVIKTDPAKYQGMIDWFMKQPWWLKLLLATGVGITGASALNMATGGDVVGSTMGILAGLGMGAAAAYGGGLFDRANFQPTQREVEMLNPAAAQGIVNLPTEIEQLHRPILDSLSRSASPQAQAYVQRLAESGNLGEYLAYMMQANDPQSQQFLKQLRQQLAIAGDSPMAKLLKQNLDRAEIMLQKGFDPGRVLGGPSDPSVGYQVLEKIFGGDVITPDAGQYLSRMLSEPGGVERVRSYIRALKERVDQGDGEAAIALNRLVSILNPPKRPRSWGQWATELLTGSPSNEVSGYQGIPLDAYRRLQEAYRGAY